MQKLKTKFAFTLIETLIVVIIVGVLATLAYKQYEAGAVRAKSAEIVSTVSLIALGEDRYLAEFGQPLGVGTTGAGMRPEDYAAFEDQLGVTIPQNSEFDYYVQRFWVPATPPTQLYAVEYVWRRKTNKGLCYYSHYEKKWYRWPGAADEWAKYLKLPQ